MKALLPFAILLGASAASAVPAVPPTQLQRTQLTQPGAPQPAKLPGVSDAGNAILAKAQTTPDPMLVDLAGKQRAVHQQIVAAVMAPTVDLTKLGALLKQQQGLITQVLARRDDRLLQVAAQLTPADRSAFLHALANPPGGGAPR
ncbi:hypothetical protein [Sphingomonas nostoxanthinifaciens]|uniref:hypothetical protein n=1 Tax=Sphingomonas nostoxanthinifaciens TaxID=2872652 RepID=UPI001CC1F2A9|nr:hypothetical protein [Sphingomonas nostoxanthinifaciens]UAK26212.1 hypothetical protein K8P63_08980 [Sphingomonas nostoxanthinifaciens]